MAERITGQVVRIITDDELIMNLGSNDGVQVGQIFAVLDPLTQDVTHPVTGQVLGSLDRVKARVAVTQVGERLSLARVHGRVSGISGAARVLSGGGPVSRKTADRWVEGVGLMDPVVSTGKRIVSRSTEAKD